MGNMQQMTVDELARAMYDQDMAYAPVDAEERLLWDKLTAGFYRAKALALFAFVGDGRRFPTDHPLGA